MNHKAKMKAQTGNRNQFFGNAVSKRKTVKADEKNNKKLKKDKRGKPFSIEEMMFYDWLDGED